MYERLFFDNAEAYALLEAAYLSDGLAGVEAYLATLAESVGETALTSYDEGAGMPVFGFAEHRFHLESCFGPAKSLELVCETDNPRHY